MICLFSYGSSLVIQSINFPVSRSFIYAEARVRHFVPARGIDSDYSAAKGSSERLLFASGKSSSSSVPDRLCTRSL